MTIKDSQLLFVVGLEVYHLLECDNVAPAAAVKPKLVNGSFVDSLRLANLVIVEFETHKLI